MVYGKASAVKIAESSGLDLRGTHRALVRSFLEDASQTRLLITEADKLTAFKYVVIELADEVV